MDLIPIKIMPREKFIINLIYRSSQVIGIDPTRTDEGYL
jgi:hypothetical protein